MNLGPASGPLVGKPAASGLAIEFGRHGGGIPLSDWTFQLMLIAANKITNDMLLKLSFADATNQCSGSYSLDGGSSFESPFSPVGWGRVISQPVRLDP